MLLTRYMALWARSKGLVWLRPQDRLLAMYLLRPFLLHVVQQHAHIWPLTTSHYCNIGRQSTTQAYHEPNEAVVSAR